MDKKQAEFQLEDKVAGPVECLGMTFPSDEARRAYFLERLKERLQDPEFRKIPGFPKGSDEDILRMSDPPYYTACPNPFLAEFVATYGHPYDPNEEYHRKPFAVDVSVGKTDALYKAHSYHTKVPHLAIVPSILHYTKPGDIVLDGFGGSGMTGVAAEWASVGVPDYGGPSSLLGARRAMISDLSPVATFMAHNYTARLDINRFDKEAHRLLNKAKRDLGWMYATTHEDGSLGTIEFVVWSEVLSCPECGTELVFLKEALDTKTKRVREQFPCTHCGVTLTKDKLEKRHETTLDPASQTPMVCPKRVPYFIQYVAKGIRHEKIADNQDLALLQSIDESPIPWPFPSHQIPHMHMTHERARLDLAGVSAVHHFYLPRQLRAIAYMWDKAQTITDTRTRNMVLFFVEQAIWTMSIMNRYRPTGFSQVNQYMTGVYYVPSQISEVSPWYALEGKLERLLKTFGSFNSTGSVFCSINSCTSLQIPDASVDYVFTDPPFGENIYYSDLNYLIESWHGLLTASTQEAIVDKAKNKGLLDYQHLMYQSFAEYFRVLKPGRWMTVVFSNSSNAVWRAIQEGIGTAGFVIADVRTLDKQQGSYRQVTSAAMKQDLVISAYKPPEKLTKTFSLDAGTEESAWAFVDEHLSNVPLFVSHADEGEVVAERTAQMLLDRMIAFHVQRGITVPLSASEFFAGLEQRYTRIDGMYLRSDQVAEYNKQRSKVQKIRQLTYHVSDEASAILWVRNELEQKPQTFPELNHTFLPISQAWVGHEEPVELKHILDENFLQYEGAGPVPTRILTYLRKNYHELRGLSEEHPLVQAKAKDRYYNPDPNKQGELDALRQKRLVKEFEEYKNAKKKLKQFRTEAVRAGFKASYDAKDFKTIIEVAKKLPEKVIQEDDKLLMYYDYALMVTEE